MTKIIIIGGVSGGMSAAARLRRLMEEAQIIVFDKGPYVSFANCGLPFHVSGEIAERSDLLVQTPETLNKRFALDIRTETEVLAIDPSKKEVTAVNQGKIYKESYDKLILSPGAKPFIPKIPGLAEAENVFTLRSIPDLDRIMEKLQHTAGGKAAVVGAGFIGLEMAENLTKKGMDVTLIEKANHILPPFDEEMAALAEEELHRQGITVYTNQAVQLFKDKGKTLILEDGRQLKSDLTILAVGVQPESELAQAAGLQLGERSGIIVNENYQTSNPDIYAVGDAILVKQELTKKDSLISLAGPANRQGRQVADIIAGLPRKNKGSLGTAIVRIFDKTATSTGLNEGLARRYFPHTAVLHIAGKDHAGYYPDAADLNLKLIFDSRTGAIYGAQAVGEKGVDKRIDVLATAIKAKLTVFDLPELEFSYAPPFGSAKDPVHIAGYAASNIIEGQSTPIQWYDLDKALAGGEILLDVRTKEEFKQGHITGSCNLPLNDLRSQMASLDKSKDYIVSCHSGQRSYIAERILKQNGFRVHNLDGAYSLYRRVKPEKISTH
ncbi:CoA-disulfide reductase [Streptococcus chenjunshii]|uniref:CoA-disulfide reductase n=1 Tax=Streptococcus chenjunshii TaxID=2173853 RepID=A0A372KMG7_9STRE|nr:FAD-dependent oxidoreductase [Streptococcus chenjunshii]AXQ78156.1 CoA-disulfide reductase [Streptococcus chenjunshii]RFU50699.1 CoA-disulfide reductase [Streptococcus chenjunshii]RFU53471.1 CoA-disulfide reductase [Streptococcus chenjunshii]